jgi:hydroxymethylpyrimidine pyrophosphatase-like HAD family hydrolase
MPQLLIWDPFVDLTDEPPHGVDAEPHDAYVLHFIGLPDEVAAARDRVAALALADIDLFHQDFWLGHHQLHVRPRGVDKAAGLAHVLRGLGVRPDELLAAGDWWNDVGMLSMARVSVAPGNAVEGVRAAANHALTGTCEDDAVVRFLEESLRTL